MRLASWNVNGLRAIAKKGFFEWIVDYDPDVVLVQETKVNEEQIPEELRILPGFFESRFHSAKKKGYSGVAIYTRFEPDEWIVGLGDEEYDSEGRVISARFADLVVTSVYFPNSQDGASRLPYKLGFNERIQRFFGEQQEKGRHILVGGDFNVAHQLIDIARPEDNEGCAGFTVEEREWFSRFLAAGYRDTWREQHPDVRDVYSWWSMRTRGRERNQGWRIDYFCVDEGLWPDVRKTDIQTDVEGSDHCPVTIEIKNPK